MGDRRCDSARRPCGCDKSPPKRELLLDVIGCQRELTVIGHVDVIKYLPFTHHHNLHLLEQFYNEPGNYSGRPSMSPVKTARVTNYGNHFLALTLYDDLTRPEVGEFLLNRGWSMIGCSSSTVDSEFYVMEKWTSKNT